MVCFIRFTTTVFATDFLGVQVVILVTLNAAFLHQSTAFSAMGCPLNSSSLKERGPSPFLRGCVAGDP